MITKKQYLKSRPIVKVSLAIAASDSAMAESIHVVGDFNAWNTVSHPMKKNKSGDFKITLELDANTEHQFRYLVNNYLWMNELEADKFVPTAVSEDCNSVLVL